MKMDVFLKSAEVLRSMLVTMDEGIASAYISCQYVFERSHIVSIVGTNVPMRHKCSNEAIHPTKALDRIAKMSFLAKTKETAIMMLLDTEQSSAGAHRMVSK